MKFQVILHEGVVAEATHPRLIQELRRVSRHVLGTDENAVKVEITTVPSGRFFTAAEPSRTSMIGTSVPAGTSQNERTRLMSEITAAWCAVTGCAANEVVVSASDAPV